jgi:transposase
MATLSMDLRRRIVTAYDRKQGTQEEVAKRFEVSLGMVKKLLAQRRRTGDIAARHRFSGRKPKILPEDRRCLQALVAQQPDLTLAQLRTKAGLECTLPAIHYVLVDLGLTYKKRRCGPPSKAARTS